MGNQYKMLVTHVKFRLKLILFDLTKTIKSFY